MKKNISSSQTEVSQLNLHTLIVVAYKGEEIFSSLPKVK